ncbi:Flp pilus assembly complex ATPase component TadA [Burkholderia gladioli]|uniref:Type II/IV secretion system family protein n=1 Tax=Burkholderia gladioli TaxID=28095 RepID=A0AAW3FA26_BURGA|nr:ATPase, T2SS/T4P/T4SS family [Burkholderia gladioli]KGC20213.1 type II/IV secretion system family protein [Burkholderia gladioli]MBU9198819.1 Flp pilus assembly complex ATPase component TadA [Burkholderia gladioli]
MTNQTMSGSLSELDFSDLYLEPNGRAWYKRFSRDPHRHELTGDLLEQARKLDEPAKKQNKDDFRIALGDRSLRGRILPTLSGNLVVLRRLMLRNEVPDVETLYPVKLVNALMSAELASGGVLLITGPTGSGKTVAAMATVIARLTRFGGAATSLENPVEIVAEGVYRGPTGAEGTLYQTEVTNDLDFGPQIQARSRAAPDIIFIGEIRTAAAMAQAALAALSGVVVIATSHAENVLSGVERFRAMVRDAGYETGLFSNAIGVIVHQTMTRTELPDGTVQRKYDVSPLVVRGAVASSAIRGQLMKEDLRPLQSHIDQQHRAMHNPSPGVPL